MFYEKLRLTIESLATIDWENAIVKIEKQISKEMYVCSLFLQ